MCYCAGIETPGDQVAPEIAAEVAKLAPDLRLPSLRVVGRKGRALEIAYRSSDGLTDLAEGQKRARAEGRPILLWVTGDDPLERC